jgi:hypothetical protein
MVLAVDTEAADTTIDGIVTIRLFVIIARTGINILIAES